MRTNKYDGNGNKIKVSLSIQERAERTLKALWERHVKPKGYATLENIFYGFIFSLCFAVLCFIAHGIFYFSSDLQSAKGVLQSLKAPVTFVLIFAVAYLFKITTSGNWLNNTVSFVKTKINKFSEKRKAKRINNNKLKMEI